MSPCVYPFSKMAVKWRELTWPCKSPKFNLHYLRKISTGFKMAVLTPKSGIIQTKLLTALFKSNIETKEYSKFVET